MGAYLAAGLPLAVVTLTLFGLLADEVFDQDLAPVDVGLARLVHGFTSPGMDPVMWGLTNLGSWLGDLSVIVLVSVILWRFGRRDEIVALAVAWGGGVLLEQLLKLTFHRTRPDLWAHVLVRGYSFPSGHALNTFCLYGVLSYLAWTILQSLTARLLILVVSTSLVLGIGLSRIYLGVHYPTDVVAGYLAAIFWLDIVILGLRAYQWKSARGRTSSPSRGSPTGSAGVT